MNRYEAMFILHPRLKGQELDDATQMVNDLINKQGGSIEKAAIWHKERPLAFPIKKQQEGTYYLTWFRLSPDKLDALRQSYRLKDEVLRLLITVLERC